MGYYDQIAARAGRDNLQLIQQLQNANNPPDVVENPNYYNTPNGQADLKQQQSAAAAEVSRNLQSELTRQSQLQTDESGQPLSDQQKQDRAETLAAARESINATQPLVNSGAFSVDDQRRAVGQSVYGALNHQSTVAMASRDWASLEKAYRSSFIDESQMAGAVEQFHNKYGFAADSVPGFLAYHGNLAPSLANSEYMTLQQKLFQPLPGVDPQSQSAARGTYMSAAALMSHPGVTKDEAAQLQAQFVKMHPDVASQLGVPQPMRMDQLQQLSGQHNLASAQEQAGGVPIMQDAKGNPIVNPGFVALQKHSVDSAKLINEQGKLAHQQWLETHTAENDYLKSINPGKEPSDPTALEKYNADKQFFQSESRRIIGARMATPAPQSNANPNIAPPQPARDQSTVGKPMQPASFNDGASAERAFQSGQLPAGKQFLFRGVPVTFDSQGRVQQVK